MPSFNIGALLFATREPIFLGVVGCAIVKNEKASLSVESGRSMGASEWQLSAEHRLDNGLLTNDRCWSMAGAAVIEIIATLLTHTASRSVTAMVQPIRKHLRLLTVFCENVHKTDC